MSRGNDHLQDVRHRSLHRQHACQGPGCLQLLQALLVGGMGRPGGLAQSQSISQTQQQNLGGLQGRTQQGSAWRLRSMLVQFCR